jgi:hypothetical protein
VVTTRITQAGLLLLASLDEPLEALQRGQLAHMSRKDLETLRRLLEVARSPEPARVSNAGAPAASPAPRRAKAAS